MNESNIEPSNMLSVVRGEDTEIIADKLNGVFSDRGIRAKVALKNAHNI